MLLIYVFVYLTDNRVFSMLVFVRYDHFDLLQ